MPRWGHQQNVRNLEPFNLHSHFRTIYSSSSVCALDASDVLWLKASSLEPKACLMASCQHLDGIIILKKLSRQDPRLACSHHKVEIEIDRC